VVCESVKVGHTLTIHRLWMAFFCSFDHVAVGWSLRYFWRCSLPMWLIIVSLFPLELASSGVLGWCCGYGEVKQFGRLLTRKCSQAAASAALGCWQPCVGFRRSSCLLGSLSKCTGVNVCSRSADRVASTYIHTAAAPALLPFSPIIAPGGQWG